jgi:hypothetical protein
MLRWRLPEVHPLPSGQLQRLILDECDAYEDILDSMEILNRTSDSPSPAGTLLLDSLEEVRRRIVRRIFRILGLGYSVTDMERAHQALGRGSTREQSNTLEFLDNVLPRTLKRRLIPLVEARPPGTAAGGSRESVLRRLAGATDPWLSACALHVARIERLGGLEDAARRARTSADHALREEAEAMLAGERA